MKSSASRFIFLFSILSLGVLARALVHDDIICENRGTKDEKCYPRVFQATEEFQPVRPGQAIPKGLHVRLNLQTGEKEAKLYDPSQDTDQVNAVEVFPDEPPSSVNVTAPLDDRPPLAFDEDHNPSRREKAILSEMRRVAMDAPIKPPIGAGGDMKDFRDSKEQIRLLHNKNNTAYTSARSKEAYKAWDDLEDLCHDVYWGLQLTKDQDFLKVLYDGVTTNAEAWDAHGMSARILGTALQNNKAAIDAFRNYVRTRDGLFVDEKPQATKTFMELVSEQFLSGTVDRDIELTYLVSKLLGNHAFLADFVSSDALFNLKRTLYHYRTVWSENKSGWNYGKYKRLLGKAMILAEDHILVDDLISRVSSSIYKFPEACPDSEGSFDECPEETQQSSELRKALYDRIKWCDVSETAFEIVFSHDLGHRDKKTSISTLRDRWIPHGCDSKTHDASSGEAHNEL